MSFLITEKDLCRIYDQGGLTTPKKELIFLGVRGAQPDQDSQFATQVKLDGSLPYDHVSYRCTLLQHDGKNGKIAAFPASTVPSEKYVKKAIDKELKANMLAPGFYRYTVGKHPLKKTSTQHDAFREDSPKLILRTKTDKIFDFEEDHPEIGNPFDNIHAGWSLTGFSSAGCQVVQGTPALGAWPRFKENGYHAHANGQKYFYYLLLNSSYLKHLIQHQNERFVISGSKGELASAVQSKLIELGFLEGNADGMFGVRSALALVKFQRKSKNLLADAVCGAKTLRELNLLS